VVGCQPGTVSNGAGILLRVVRDEWLAHRAGAVGRLRDRSPPRNVSDACAIFAEYGDWRPAAQAASRRWGAPLPVLLAIIHQESAFRADARPPRTWYLGFIPGPRSSSAYGYSQALDGTWDHYIAATGNRSADRNQFDAAVDFVGWYVNETARRNHVAKNDAYRQYLAYHEGHGGFAQGSYRKKTWLMERARQVSRQADRYRAQLARCEPQLATR
jgi:hypothetical protein